MKNQELQEEDIEGIQEVDLSKLSKDKTEEELVSMLKKSLIEKRQQKIVSDNPYITEEVMKLDGIDSSEIIVINDHIGSGNYAENGNTEMREDYIRDTNHEFIR